MLEGQLPSILAGAPTPLPTDALLAIFAAGPDMQTMAKLRRPAIENAIALLIDALDAIDPDTDLEPYMGRPETGAVAPQRDTGWGGDECEDDADGEPSLGSIGSTVGAAGANQTQWATGSRQDLEQDVQDEPHDPEPAEPDLGSLEGLEDQRSWAAFARDDEPSLGAPEIHHDQRQGHRATRAAGNSTTTSARMWSPTIWAATTARHASAATPRPCSGARA